MPARTVVISSSRKPTEPKSADGIDGKRELTPNEFHQMSGRAGRRGIDKRGFVYTMATSTPQLKKFDALINAKPNNLKSHFDPDFSFITGYYKLAKDDNLIKEILSKSLQSYDTNSEIAHEKTKSLTKTFEQKKEILKEFEYMAEDNKLTEKGELLSKLNGYLQIPIIDIIYDKKLSFLTPIELAACVGSMATADEKVAARIERDNKRQEAKDQRRGNNPTNSKFEHESEPLKWFIGNFDMTLIQYNAKMAKSRNYQKVAQDKTVAKHLYTWAKLNNESDDSRKNWEELYNLYSPGGNLDEGGLFKEINKTLDLLKQITKIADVGQDISETEQDKEYYRELKSIAKEAIKLLMKEPMQELET